ncbi:hypothetical protein IWZ03DRAFT_203008 [Phyllosticta citriasiana]|uniref:F-box domain-containing protein n=1 Tax=Phyllosticta citriasiana TaxID=595635 RepID=A0ABR1KI85_9PEZI
MASFNDLNDDVLLIIIDILAEENLVRKPSQPRRNHLTHSVSLWGGRHLPGPGEKLLLGYRLSIPPTLARTRTLRAPHPYALELPLDNSERSHHEFARLLTAPARLERLDVHYPDMPVDDLLYPGINLGRFDLGGRKELNLPFTLDHVKTLSIHMISKALVPFCPNLEKIRIMTSAAGEDSWGSGEGRGFPGVLCDCAKLPRLVDFEMNRRIGPNVLEPNHRPPLPLPPPAQPIPSSRLYAVFAAVGRQSRRAPRLPHGVSAGWTRGTRLCTALFCSPCRALL